MSRGNLSWYLGNGTRTYQIYPFLPPGYRLRDGDAAVIRPPPSKADPTAQIFGNQPVYLPYIEDDMCNAAWYLAELEVAIPRHEDRDSIPLFVIDDEFNPLDCGRADYIFNKLAVAALGKQRASEVSMHSLRVEHACALLANGASDGLIQALARWSTVESLKIYARLSPADYMSWVRKAARTQTESTLAHNIAKHGRSPPPTCDSDLHQDMRRFASPLDGGADIADTLAVYESDDDEEEAAAGASSDAAEPAPQRAGGASKGKQRAAGPAAREQPASRKRPTDCALKFQQDNPKRANSKSYIRYDKYKHAETRASFYALGGTAADLAHDTKKGFVLV